MQLSFGICQQKACPTLYNTLVVKVKEQKLNANQNTIYKGSLPNGVYFYHLNSGNTLIESGKVIFE